MALTDDNGGMGTTMLVQPTGLNTGNGFGNGFGDNGSFWILLLFILLGGNAWGGGFGGFGGIGGELYPWMNQAGITTNGFQNQLLNDNITSIRDGVHGLSTQLCNCCSDVQMSLANGFANVEQGANARQMANMQTAFNQQTAMAQGFNALGSQFADCCCENRLGIADLKYTVATENCADRQALNEGVRDIIANQTAGYQRIIDQLCADKIEQKNDTIAQLRQELLYARGQASQDVQTATLRTGQATTANQLISELRSCPIPAMPVYGQTPIFTCNNQCGCGCGCNS